MRVRYKRRRTVCSGGFHRHRREGIALKPKRPLGTVGFVILGSLAAIRFSLFLPLFAAAVILLSVLSLKRRRLERFAAICLCAALATFGFHTAYAAVRSYSTGRYANRAVYVNGFICEPPALSEGGAFYTVKAFSVTSGGKTRRSSCKGTIWLDDTYSPDIYDSLEFSATALPLDEEASADGVSFRFSLTDAPRFTGQARRTPYYYCLRFRQYMLRNLTAEGGGERFTLLSALLLGDKSGLSDDTRLAFRRCGVTHLLVVSGLHIVTVSMFCFVLMQRLMKRRKYAPTLITLAVIWFFTAMTGFAPSAVRAAVMCSFLLAGTLLGRESDPLNSLGAAAGIMCVCEPSIIYSAGFLLSFSATLGLILLAPRLYILLLRLMRVSYRTAPLPGAICRGLALSLSQSLAAWVFTLPVIFAQFRNISLLTPLSNLLTVTPAMLALLLALPAAILPYIGIPFLRAAAAISDWLIWITARIAEIPFAYLYAGYAFVGLSALSAVILFLLARKHSRIIRAGFAISLAACVFFCGAFSLRALRDDRMKITAVFQSGGQADFISKDGVTLLYISDIPQSRCSALFAAASLRGISSVDALIVGDRSSSAAAPLIAERLDIPRVLLPVSAIEQEYPVGCLSSAVDGADISAFTDASVTLSGDSRLTLYVGFGSATLVFTSEPRLREPYNTVFASGDFTPSADSGLLVLPGRSAYSEPPDGFTVMTTSEEGILSFACDGRNIYAEV